MTPILLTDFFIFIFVFLSQGLYPVTGRATFYIGNQTFSNPTQDPFQVYPEKYNATGVLLIAEFIEGEACKLKPPALNETILPDKHVIIAIDESQLKHRSCTTLNRAVSAVKELSDVWESTGKAYVQAVLFLMKRHRKNDVPGAPQTISYTTVRQIPFNGPPAIRTLLLRRRAFKDIMSHNTNPGDRVVVFVEQESGPWNDAFSKIEYTIFLYFCTSVFIVAAIYGFIKLVKILKNKTYPSPRQFFIFYTTLFAICLIIPIMFMNVNGIAAYWLIQIREITFLITFHQLLSLWHSVLIEIHDKPYVQLIKITIWFSLIGNIICESLIILCDSALVVPMLLLGKIIVLSVSVIMYHRLTFTLLGFVFFRLQSIFRVKTDALRALQRLTLIYAISIIGQLIAFTTVIFDIFHYWRYGPAMIIAYSVESTGDRRQKMTIHAIKQKFFGYRKNSEIRNSIGLKSSHVRVTIDVSSIPESE
ncbi:hypothetical protein BDF19DRAFT_442387 [Syncephalis fuscata]|nr:hypothetical protein BDF19DRAFT_442387 [Syncephalis fuscata]